MNRIQLSRTLRLDVCTIDDIAFTFTTIHSVGLKLNTHPCEIMRSIGAEKLVDYMKVADVTHQYPPTIYESEFIEEFNIQQHNYDARAIWKDELPRPSYFGNIYSKLIGCFVILDKITTVEAVQRIFDSDFPESLLDYYDATFFTMVDELYEMFHAGAFSNNCYYTRYTKDHKLIHEMQRTITKN